MAIFRSARRRQLSTQDTDGIRGFPIGTTGMAIYGGAGSPEGVITAVVGSSYHRSDGGAKTSFYVKESGTGNTGWVAQRT